MSRGIRTNTFDRIMLARGRDPLGIGPIIGELATVQAIPATLLAELIGTQPQTIMRWIFGQSEVQVYWLPQVTKIYGFLLWRRLRNVLPLGGTSDQRRETLMRDVVDFKAAIKSSSRILKSKT